MQPLGDQAPDRALAGARQSDEHDVPFHPSPPDPLSALRRGGTLDSGRVRTPTCARYPSTLRFVSLSASPPNFSSNASASTIAIIASAMTPMAGTAVTSERSDCACAGLPVLRSTVLSGDIRVEIGDRKSTRLNSSHPSISYAVFCLKKKR